MTIRGVALIAALHVLVFAAACAITHLAATRWWRNHQEHL